MRVLVGELFHRVCAAFVSSRLLSCQICFYKSNWNVEKRFLIQYLKNLINYFLARRVARGLSVAQRRRSTLKAIDTLIHLPSFTFGLSFLQALE